MPSRSINPDQDAEELAIKYGLEPTTIENLRSTQSIWEKTLGRKVSLEEVYFREFDQRFLLLLFQVPSVRTKSSTHI
jgi:hypothetical protein